MRMWGIDPKFMCRKHLLGEHVEMHMFVGCIQKKKNLNGYIENKLVDISKIKDRHNRLVKEMEKRGYNHKSPLQLFQLHEIYDRNGMINIKENKLELYNRCENCRKRMEEYGYKIQIR